MIFSLRYKRNDITILIKLNPASHKKANAGALLSVFPLENGAKNKFGIIKPPVAPHPPTIPPTGPDFPGAT